MSDYTPFKMKGSPLQRNFGIGSPAKQKIPGTGISKGVETTGGVTRTNYFGPKDSVFNDPSVSEKTKEAVYKKQASKWKANVKMKKVAKNTQGAKLKSLATKTLKTGKRLLGASLGKGLLVGAATELMIHGAKQIKEGKAKIPKGYYKKGGKGYKKRDYSKKFNFGND